VLIKHKESFELPEKDKDKNKVKDKEKEVTLD